MAKTTTAISSDFKSRLHVLDFTRKKTDQLFFDNLITRRDREQIYKGLFLESVVAFESAIEDLFLGLLTKKIIPRSRKTLPRVFFSSIAVAKPIVFARSYYDWLPYDHTTKRANHFFRDGRPFSALVKIDTDKILEVLAIRNAIAHKSDYSKKQFEELVIGSRAVPVRERMVGAYLSGNLRSSPVQTRYENLILEMATIFEKICLF